MWHAPETKTLPFKWYETPNIRVITINDFKTLCKGKIDHFEGNCTISECFFNLFGNAATNLFSKKGIFVLERT